RLRHVQGPAIVEAHHAGLAQGRVEDVEVALPLPEVGERRVPLPVPGIGEHRMAVAEGAAARILAGEADGNALVEQRREREVLADAPAEALAAVAFRELTPAYEH